MYRENVVVAHVIKEMQDQYGWPEFITVTTGKNKTERVVEIAKIIDGKMTLTGSVQSLDVEVQNNMKRSNISSAYCSYVSKSFVRAAFCNRCTVLGLNR